MFAGSELDPVSGANAGMTITDIKPYPTWQGHRNIMLFKQFLIGQDNRHADRRLVAGDV